MKEKIAKPKKYRQNSVPTHFHPRSLARKVIHNKLMLEGASGVNKVAPGTTQSPFARQWRSEADLIANDMN